MRRVCLVLKIHFTRLCVVVHTGTESHVHDTGAVCRNVHHVTVHAEPPERNEILPEENSFVRKVSERPDVLLHERQLGLRVCGHF